MRIFVASVIAAGSLLPLLIAVRGGWLDRKDWPAIALLFVLGCLSERFSLHLTHKTAITVSSAAYLAAVFALPPSIPGFLAFGAGLTGHLARRRGDPIEALFNAGLRGVAFTAAAFTYDTLRDRPHLGPGIAGLGGIGALIATALVAIVAGLQLESNPIRIFAVTFKNDLLSEAAIALVAVQIAYLVLHEIVLAPIVALLLLLLYLVIRDSVQLKTDTN
jgi:hypothetical protein